MSKYFIKSVCFFSSVILVSIICSCFLISSFPLSNSNNFHEEKLEGTWAKEKTINNHKETETVEIRDSGNKYFCRYLEKKTAISFILTKLDSFYFISLYDQKDDCWLIFRIQISEDNFQVLGLNDKGLKLIERIQEKRNKKTYIKVSQRELQNWCVQHADLFTEKIVMYNKHTNVVSQKSSNSALLSFVEIFCNHMLEAENGFPKNNTTSTTIKEYGSKIKKASYKMFSVISKAKIPSDVRDAALELAQNYDSMGNLLVNAPYIPADFAEGFLVGLLKGAAGDPTGGYGEFDDWRKKVKQTIDSYNEKKQRFIVILIKHGVEFPSESEIADAKRYLEKAKSLATAKNFTAAVKWYRKAAEQGNAEAQFHLGVCYSSGQGVSRDDAEAVKWWRKAAEQGLAEAQYNLGFCYANGQGIQQDIQEAMKWWRQVAEKGYAGAQFNLGLCYDSGQGVSQDYGKAVKWYRKAAEQGLAEAQYNLGVCYANGQGVKQDISEAIKWWRKAAEQGLEPAKKALKKQEK